jgi:uroporphyrinogen decarboxylase
MNLFESTLARNNLNRPPVWFMRQAGRYHSHYQALRKKYSFIELCKKPEVACEATMGPIQDFDFDAAILFSDLLFPLEVMGMGLKYEEGPKLDWHLRQVSDLKNLQGGAQLASGLSFQAEAMQLIRRRLSPEKGLLGFVGGPLTLFCYAVEGSHQGNLDSARAGLKDGRFEGFFERLKDLLVENMRIQAEAGASTIAVLDTCAGEFNAPEYREYVQVALRSVLESFRLKVPGTPVVYYSKGTSWDHWDSLKGLPFAGLGVDWRTHIDEVLSRFGDRWAIQGNVDPHWLFLESSDLESRLRKVFGSVLRLPVEKRRGWICGLGHGVLPKTPESNVRLFLKIQKEMFSVEQGSEVQS